MSELSPSPERCLNSSGSEVSIIFLISASGRYSTTMPSAEHPQRAYGEGGHCSAPNRHRSHRQNQGTRCWNPDRLSPHRYSIFVSDPVYRAGHNRWVGLIVVHTYIPILTCGRDLFCIPCGCNVNPWCSRKPLLTMETSYKCCQRCM